MLSRCLRWVVALGGSGYLCTYYLPVKLMDAREEDFMTFDKKAREGTGEGEEGKFTKIVVSL